MYLSKYFNIIHTVNYKIKRSFNKCKINHTLRLLMVTSLDLFIRCSIRKSNFKSLISFS